MNHEIFIEIVKSISLIVYHINCVLSNEKNASFHLKFESVSKDKYQLCLFISVEVDKSIRDDKK